MYKLGTLIATTLLLAVGCAGATTNRDGDRPTPAPPPTPESIRQEASKIRLRFHEFPHVLYPGELEVSGFLECISTVGGSGRPRRTHDRTFETPQNRPVRNGELQVSFPVACPEGPVEVHLRAEGDFFLVEPEDHFAERVAASNPVVTVNLTVIAGAWRVRFQAVRDLGDTWLRIVQDQTHRFRYHVIASDGRVALYEVDQVTLRVTQLRLVPA